MGYRIRPEAAVRQKGWKPDVRRLLGVFWTNLRFLRGAPVHVATSSTDCRLRGLVDPAELCRVPGAERARRLAHRYEPDRAFNIIPPRGRHCFGIPPGSVPRYI